MAWAGLFLPNKHNERYHCDVYIKYQLVNSRNEALGDKLALEVRMGLDDMELHKK